MSDEIKILVDADACPVKPEIVELALKYGLKMIFVTNLNHELRNGKFSEEMGENKMKLIEFVITDNDRDAADYAVANRASRGDIVVTQDYGLSALVLSKGGCPITVSGKIFTDTNIGGFLEARHISRKERMGGKRTKGPKAFSDEDRKRFSRNLERLILDGINKKSV